MARTYSMTYQTIWLCVDDEGFSGSFTIIGQNQSRDISSLADFLLSADEMLDATPYSADAARPEDFREGVLASFLIRILRREHQSWQGIVRWIEGRQEQCFRSALELANLIDSAIHGDRCNRFRRMKPARRRV